MKVISSNLARHALDQKLITHFRHSGFTKEAIKVKTNTTSGESNELSPIVYYDYLADAVGLNDLFYPVQVNRLNLLDFLDYKKFVKSALYTFFSEGESFVRQQDKHRYKMSMYLVGSLWLVYRSDIYDGVGGMHVHNPESDEAFSCEPIKNYLDYHYPKPESD